MIRITGGTWRGRTVRVPVADGVRPTSERAREALFSIVGQDLGGVSFLDAFGGTGAVALDAASRGADVVVVERDRRALADLEARRDALDARNVRVVAGDVLALARTLGTFGVVFADPPWKAPVDPIVAALGPLATDVFVLEADEDTVVPDVAGGLPLERSRSYGRTTLHVYRTPS